MSNVNIPDVTFDPKDAVHTIKTALATHAQACEQEVAGIAEAADAITEVAATLHALLTAFAANGLTITGSWEDQENYHHEIEATLRISTDFDQ